VRPFRHVLFYFNKPVVVSSSQAFNAVQGFQGMVSLFRTPFWLTLLCLCLGGPLAAAHARQGPARTPITLHDHSSHVAVDGRIEYLIEPHPMSPSRAAGAAYRDKWAETTAQGLNFGSLHPPVWFRFDVVNQSEEDHSWWMEVGWPLLDRVEVALYNHATGEWHSRRVLGNLVSLQARPLHHRHFLFPLNLPPGERNTVYMRVETRGALLVTMDLWQQNAFLLNEQVQILVLGLFFGILIVMLLYNLSLFFFTRDRSYLFYSIYVFFIVLYALAETGLGTQYLWGQSLWLKRFAYPLFASASFLSAALFMRQFLALKEHGGWVYHSMMIFIAYWTYSVLSFLLYSHDLVILALGPAAILSCVMGWAVGIYLWAKGNASAKYFTIAWTLLNAGTILHVLMLTRTIERTLVTQYSQMVGFVLEVVLLSIALAERINRERKVREAAQTEVLHLAEKVSRAREEKLMVQEQMLAIERRANEELEVRVLDRTNELERAMKNLEMANKELSKMSYTDPMTKLYNRRYFDQILSSEVKRASRTRQPVSVILADIDHFKQVNDLHGHLIGDECLRIVAATMSQQMGRTSDLIARFGGEEFAMILPATAPQNALIVADRARAAVEKINFIHRGNRIDLRISLGVAGWVPEASETPDRILAMADKALYDAKQGGRNRAVAADAA
jgi:two-component system, sensor histidine kinase LadS